MKLLQEPPFWQGSGMQALRSSSQLRPCGTSGRNRKKWCDGSYHFYPPRTPLDKSSSSRWLNQCSSPHADKAGESIHQCYPHNWLLSIPAYTDIHNLLFRSEMRKQKRDREEEGTKRKKEMTKRCMEVWTNSTPYYFVSFFLYSLCRLHHWHMETFHIHWSFAHSPYQWIQKDKHSCTGWHLH